MISNRIKNLIFGYLLKDLHKVEIIYYRDSIWFIDRENRYWYFEYHKVDNHLWWRWSHFTSALNMFSMEAEEKQYLFGDLVNMILIKKQKLESKYPNQVFETVGSIMNIEVIDDVVPNNEIKTIDSHLVENRPTYIQEVLNCEVKTTTWRNYTRQARIQEVLNCEVKTTDGAFHNDEIVTNEVLNYEVEKIHEHRSPQDILVKNILEHNAETISSEIFTDTLYKEDIDEVLSVDIKTIDYSKTHRLRPVTGALDYNPETSKGVKGNLKYEVRKVLEETVEIKSIKKLKGENPFQDIIVGHILDESDKVTDKLKMKEDDYVKTFGHDVYMCDHLV